MKVNAQGPTLNLVGSSPSFTKGTINTEVLTAIIQQKQDEIKQKVFRNLIVKQFNKYSYTERLRNFATYHFVYNLMDVMTSGKNKTAITKAITENTSEFAYVFGLALYLQNDAKINGTSKNFGLLTVNSTLLETSKVNYTNNTNLTISPTVKDFNILIDLCYDVILNDVELQKKFKFKNDLSEKDFTKWYNSDNAFLLAYQNANTTDQGKLDALRAEVKTKLADLSKISENIEKLIAGINDLKNTTSAELKAKVDNTLANFSSLKASDITTELTEIKTTYAAVLTANQTTFLTNFSGLVDANYDKVKELISFYSGLQKSDFKDFTLTKDQYYALKFIIIKFLGLVKNQFENDVVASVVDFLLENTLVEYTDNGGNQKAENSVANSDKGYLYVDIESVISAVDQKFSPTNKKGIGVYIQPFVSIGTNYASFVKTNSLTTDNTGAAKSLDNLYFASEKIGIKWKIWNWKYTHSFAAGENFRYYNKPGNYRYWLRPQPKPTISDVHIIIYGSGLLYNIANLKSNDNFNYGIVGTGLGFTFFNGLSTTIGFACPFTDKKFNSTNTFFNFGIDVPIIDYIAGLKNK